MKNNVLITPTLLDKFEFVKNAPPSWKERAYISFVQMIRREPGDFPLWIKKGIEFEDAIYAQCTKASKLNKMTVDVGSPHFQTVANDCLGGAFQEVLQKDIEVDGESVHFYGKTDVSFPHIIKDIKTTLKWKGQDKYLKGFQHKIYMWISGVDKFEYVVVVWEDEKSDKIRAVHRALYNPFSFGVKPDLEYDILEAVRELFKYLRANNLWDDYYHAFSKNRR